MFREQSRVIGLVAGGKIEILLLGITGHDTEML